MLGSHSYLCTRVMGHHNPSQSWNRFQRGLLIPRSFTALTVLLTATSGSRRCAPLSRTNNRISDTRRTRRARGSVIDCYKSEIKPPGVPDCNQERINVNAENKWGIDFISGQLFALARLLSSRQSAKFSLRLSATFDIRDLVMS